MGLLAALVVAGVLCGSSAHAVLTTLSYSPSAGSLSELGATHAYTWRLDNLPTDVVTAAAITFSNVKSWEASANQLITHLLDSAKSTGVDSFLHGASERAGMAGLTDDFANAPRHGSPDWLVAPGTGDTELFGKSLTMTPDSWTHTFNEPELTRLNQYLSDGTVAFGFDSDSHYFNEGITFSMTFAGGPPPGASPIPEASAVLPLASVLLMAVAVQARSRRRAGTVLA